MIGDLYYLLGLIISVFNLSLMPSLNSILKTEEWMVTFKKVRGRYPTKTEFEEGQLMKMNLFNYYAILASLWMILGLVSKSWFVFLSLLFVNFLAMRILEKIGIHKEASKWTRIFLLSINTSVIIFLVLNHFHFHFQLLEFLFN
jgi:hypothetical protein